VSAVDVSLAPERWDALWEEYLDATDPHVLYRLNGLVMWWWPTPWAVGRGLPESHSSETRNV